MADSALASLGGSVSGFLSGALSGSTQSASEALGFVFKKKAGLIANQNAILGVNNANGEELPQTPKNPDDIDNTKLFLWAGIAVVGLISTAAFFND